MRILAVAASERIQEALTSLLREKGEYSITPAIGAAAARRLALDEEWDAVVISYPLSDEDGMDLARMITAETDAAVIMIMREELINIFSAMLSENGILTVSKPILRPILFQTLRLAETIKERLKSKDMEIKRLESRLEDARIISKAKCIMIEHGMQEMDAHRLIEKTAMDRRITLRESAYLLMKKYKEQ